MSKLTIADLEAEARKEPLIFETSDGQQFEFSDPKALTLDQIIHFSTLSRLEQLRQTMAEGQFEALRAHPEVTGYVFDALLSKWIEYYKFGDKLGATAQGESDASSR